RGPEPPGSCRSRDPRSPPFTPEGLDELTVSCLAAVVGCFVLFGVLGHDQGRLEVAVGRPASLEDGASTLAEQIRRRALVPDRDRGGPVGEGKRQIERARLRSEERRVGKEGRAWVGGAE